MYDFESYAPQNDGQIEIINLYFTRTHTHSIHIHFIHTSTHSDTSRCDLRNTEPLWNFDARKKKEKWKSIHTVKLLQIVKSMNSIRDGTRVQLCPKRIGYVRKTSIKRIHLYSSGSAKCSEHFSLANWAIRKSTISFWFFSSSSLLLSISTFGHFFPFAFVDTDACSGRLVGVQQTMWMLKENRWFYFFRHFILKSVMCSVFIYWTMLARRTNSSNYRCQFNAKQNETCNSLSQVWKHAIKWNG